MTFRRHILRKKSLSYYGAILFVVLFVVFLAIALSINPNINDFIYHPTPQSQAMQTWFDVPQNLINGTTNRGLIESNAIGSDFSMGKEVDLRLMLHIWNFKYKVDMITIQPNGCILPIENTIDVPVSSSISMFQLDNATWFGAQTIEPQTAGTLTLFIKIEYLSNDNQLQSFVATVPISNVNIKSDMDNLQQRNESQTQSIELIAMSFSFLVFATPLYFRNKKAEKEEKRKTEANKFGMDDYEGYG